MPRFVEKTFLYETTHVPSGHKYSRSMTLGDVLTQAGHYGWSSATPSACQQFLRLVRTWDRQIPDTWRFKALSPKSCRRIRQR